MTLSNWARRLNLDARKRIPRAALLPPLILITDRHRVPDPLGAAGRLPRGAAVLLRDYDMRDRASLARRLSAVCRRRGLHLLIAGDARLATLVRAEGIHFSEAAARRRLRKPGQSKRFVTVACHTAASLRRAETRGADACVLSPVFETASHPGARALGPWRFAKMVRGANLPVYALGGINAQSVRRLAASGACGIAAIGALSAMPARSIPLFRDLRQMV